jgi:hypothetical protein
MDGKAVNGPNLLLSIISIYIPSIGVHLVRHLPLAFLLSARRHQNINSKWKHSVTYLNPPHFAGLTCNWNLRVPTVIVIFCRTKPTTGQITITWRLHSAAICLALNKFQRTNNLHWHVNIPCHQVVFKQFLVNKLVYCTGLRLSVKKFQRINTWRNVAICRVIKWCFNSFNNWPFVPISVQCSVCSDEDTAFSTPKYVGTHVGFSTLLFIF